MKVFVLVDSPDYDPSTVIAVYLDEKKAVAKMNKLTKARRIWLDWQRKYDENNDDQAYLTAPPHYYDDLLIITCKLEK
jgi:hypothetical protein